MKIKHPKTPYMKREKVDRCEVTRKKIYAKKHALNAKNNHHLELYVYKCPYCKWFHLTRRAPFELQEITVE